MNATIKLLLSSVATGVVVSGGGMSTKSVGGSDGSEVEAGALVSCDRYFRFRLQTFDSKMFL